MLTKGTRVRLVHTDDPYTRLKPGDEGVIIAVRSTRSQLGNQELVEYWMKWDNGSKCTMLPYRGDVIEEVLS